MKFGLPLLVILSITACSRDPSPAASGAAGAAAPQAAGSTSDSVAAVAQGGAAGPVKVRFVVVGRPVVGVASSLRLEIAAATPLSGISVRLEGEALGLDTAASSRVIDLPEAGKVVEHSVAMTPKSAGLAEAAVHVLPSGAEAQEAVYVIPVLVDAAAAK